MKLEDLRKDDLGKISAYFPREANPTSTMVSVTYPDYCIKAFDLTYQSIEQLERSTALITQGNTTILAVGMWFISIEAFINALLRIACRILKEDFDDHRKHDIGKRLYSLLSMLKVPRESFDRSGIFQRLEEFKIFRNEIFHDRTWENELTFKKTTFSSVPYLSNQVDAVQGAIIALEVFHAFRRVYRGLDLMPDISVKKKGSIGFVKFDAMYKTLLRPFFAAVLNKHKLTSALILDPALIELGTSEISASGDVAIVVKAAQDQVFTFAPNEQETSIGADLLAKVSDAIAIDTADSFLLPRYIA
jgi:hypothetical protein